jgi:hypothetical protein
VAIGLDAPQSDDLTERVIESMMAFYEFWQQLSDWKREEGRRLIEVNGFRGLDVVALDTWLEANGASPGASADAMSRFIGEEDLPDIPELDGLRRAREDHLKERTC